MKYLKQQKGFTLLLAALIASVVLSLGSSIFLIAQKQVALSSLGRDSQFAFYAADTAAECAIYWDIRYYAFTTGSLASTVTCDGQTLSISGVQGTAPYTATFQTNVFIDDDGIPNTSDDSGYCAQVTVTKNTSNPYTVIHSDGYSVSCNAITTSARALQRSVDWRY